MSENNIDDYISEKINQLLISDTECSKNCNNEFVHEDIINATIMFLNFALSLSKNTFINFFYTIINNEEIEINCLMNVINECINKHTISSLSCLIWLFYIGFITSDSISDYIKKFIEDICDENINKNIIYDIIEKNKNNDINHEYYLNLIKLAEETYHQI